VQRYVDDLVLVDEGDIEQAIVTLLDFEKTLVEGAGAAPLAAVMKDPPPMRAQGRTGAGRRQPRSDAAGRHRPARHGARRRLARLKVCARDVPGSLARITKVVSEAGANIDEVHHQRAFTLLAAQNVEIELVVQTRGREHVAVPAGGAAGGRFPGRGGMMRRRPCRAPARYFAPWVQALALRVEAFDADSVTLRLPQDPQLSRVGGMLCGQAMMAAADTAMVLALINQFGAFRPCTTVQMNTSFLKPLAGPGRPGAGAGAARPARRWPSARSTSRGGGRQERLPGHARPTPSCKRR
jgi:acyl-coenzyme A thioesterase PaaI-like protein